MRRATTTLDRIPSPTYLQGYAFNRRGVVYYRLRGMMRSTNTRWPTTPEGRAAVASGLDEWLRSVESGGAPALVATVDELGVAWAHGPGRLVSPHVRRHMEGALGLLPEGLGLSVAGVVRALAGATVGTDLSPSTLRKRIQSLKRLFAWGVEMGYLERNPVSLTGVPVVPRNRHRPFFTVQDLNMLCEHFHQRDRAGATVPGRPGYRHAHYALLWRWLFYTGARITETLNIRWEEVTADGVLIHGKGDEAGPIDRHFPLNPFPEVAAVIEELRALRTNDWLFPWWRDAQGPGDALRKATIQLRGIREQKIAAGEEHGLDSWLLKRTVHTFRRSAETRWREELGLGIELISDLAGHDIRTQLHHYRTSRTAADLAEAVRRELGRSLSAR